MFDEVSSNRGSRDVHETDVDLGVGKQELFGAVQLLFGMMQNADGPVIVQIAGLAGGEGASSVAASLARIVNVETNGGLCMEFPQFAASPATAEMTLLPRPQADDTAHAAAISADQIQLVKPAPGEPSHQTDTARMAVVFGRLPEDCRKHTMTGGLRPALEEMFPDAGLMLIDTPPVENNLEATAVSRQVDGVILVLEADETTMTEAESAKETIETGGGKILGVIVNKRSFRVPPLLARMLKLPYRQQARPRSHLALKLVLLGVLAIGLLLAFARWKESIEAPIDQQEIEASQ